MSIGDFLKRRDEIWLNYCRGVIDFEKLIEETNALNLEFERNNDGIKF